MPKTAPRADGTAAAPDTTTAAPTPTSRDRSGRMGELVRAVPGPLIGLVAIFIAMSILSPFFLTTRNLLNIITQVSDIGIMAVGAALVIIIGGIDLSVGSTLALSMMTMAWLFKIQSWPFLAAVLVGLLIGALVGLINGLLSTYARIQPFVATLATLSAGAGLALFITDGNPVTQFPDWFLSLTSADVLGFPVEGIILIAVYLVTAFWLRFRPSGRALYAIGGNDEVARLSGINVRGLKVRVYVTAGVLAAVAGLIVTSRLDAAAPTAGTADLPNVIARGVHRRGEPGGRRRRDAGHLRGPADHRHAEQRDVAAQRLPEPAARGDRHRHHRRGAARPGRHPHPGAMRGTAVRMAGRPRARAASGRWRRR